MTQITLPRKTYLTGINVLGGAGLSFGQHLELIRNAGFDAIFTDWHHDCAEALAGETARAGLIYESIHAPFGKANLMWQDGDDGVRTADEYIACVTDCAAFGVPVVVMHPFIGFGEHTPTETGIRSFSRVVDAAVRLGVRISFENVEGEEYLAALMEAFRNVPEVGFCLDTGHELCYNRGKDMLSLYGSRLSHTHFNDNVGVTGSDITWLDDLHLVMGDGIVNWQGVMDRIRATPFDRPLMCELSWSNKPGRHTHDGYAAMGMEAFYALAYERVSHISKL